ncbi:MAG: hypothetical protein V2A71_04315 [Candidatus Eisenbacteria bacterium]
MKSSNQRRSRNPENGRWLLERASEPARRKPRARRRGRLARRVTLVTLIAAVLVLTAGQSPRLEAARGELTLDFKNANLADVVRTLSAQTGMNFVFGGDTVGAITLRMAGVSLEEALEAITRATGVEFLNENGCVIVAPSRIVTRTFALNYIDVISAKEAVSRLLSPGGKAEAFSGGAAASHAGSNRLANILIISDTEKRLSTIENVLRELDVRPRQVDIETRVIETTLGREDRLGINWQIGLEASGAVAPTTFPFDKGATSGAFATPDPGVSSSSGVTAFPAGEIFPYAKAGDFTFGKLNATGLKIALEMLASRTNSNLVANPRITTLENRPAEISVGTVVPIALYERHKETGSMEVIGYEEKKVGMKLLVTPRVGADSAIVLKVRPEVSEIVEYRGQFNERPVTSTREADTEVIVRSGETLVIGGLVKEIETVTVKKLPLLGDLPLLGRLFRHEVKAKQKVDLLVFVTPRLLTE